jgi:cell division protein FtsX
VETFKRYSIKNPLPDALFVVVKDEKQYQILKNLYNKYKDILYDIQGIDQQDSFTRQKQIVKKTLDFLNFAKIFLIFLIIFVVVVVVSILALIIKLDFYAFRRQIEVEKLLG